MSRRGEEDDGKRRVKLHNLYSHKYYHETKSEICEACRMQDENEKCIACIIWM